MIPWVDLAKPHEPRVAFGHIEAPNLKYAREMVVAVLADEVALLDLLVEPGTNRTVSTTKCGGSLAAYGISVGQPSIVPAADVGDLDLDWAMAGFASGDAAA